MCCFKCCCFLFVSFIIFIVFIFALFYINEDIFEETDDFLENEFWLNLYKLKIILIFKYFYYFIINKLYIKY